MFGLRFSLPIILLVLTTLVGPAPVMGQDQRLQVAASTPLLADIVRNVSGDRADVFSVMPEDADPHTWEASP